MKKVFALSMAALLFSGVTFAQKTQPAAKKHCCHKSCCKKHGKKDAADSTKN